MVEKAHNSKTAEAFLVRQCLEKASIEAIDSMKDEIQGARTSADVWRVKKRIAVQVSPKPTVTLPSTTTRYPTISRDRVGRVPGQPK